MNINHFQQDSCWYNSLADVLRSKFNNSFRRVFFVLLAVFCEYSFAQRLRFHIYTRMHKSKLKLPCNLLRYYSFNVIEYTEEFHQRIINMFDKHMPIKVFTNHWYLTLLMVKNVVGILSKKRHIICLFLLTDDWLATHSFFFKQITSLFFTASIFLSFVKRKVSSANNMTLSHPIAWLIPLIYNRKQNTNSRNFLFKMQTFSFKKTYFKMSFASLQPFCLCLNLLKTVR